MIQSFIYIFVVADVDLMDSVVVVEHTCWVDIEMIIIAL